jgi:transcription initiation factor TFIIIB Brf1 subunit/transcription initiation factor TFIIB
MEKYIVTLSAEEAEQLQSLVGKGKHPAAKVINALILLNCDESQARGRRRTSQEIAEVLQVSERKIDRVKRRFVEDGLEVALSGAPSTRVYEHKVDGALEAHLIALSCTAPPSGQARWSLRLLADRAVELELVEALSHETVRRVLKKTNSSRGARWAG